MAQKKNKSKDSGKTVEAKSAAAGKIQKYKTKKEEKATIISKIAENVQKIMETTTNTTTNTNTTNTNTTEGNNNKNRKQEKELNDNEAGNNNKSKNNNNKGKKDDQKNKKQKKNLDAAKKGKKTFNKETKEESSKSTDTGDNEAKWTKSKKKRLRALKAKQLKKQQQQQIESSSKSPSSNPEENTAATAATADSSIPTMSAGSSSKLQNSFKARLSGSRFRILNEELYTKDSKDSFARFSQNPELFEQYHEGFRQQASSWPVNPVDTIVKWITKRYSNQIQNHADNEKSKKSKKVVVADFGCGDAQLAQDLIQRHPNAFQVHSFDLVSKNSLVTACDMANVASKDKSVDVVVFCLALMGTNLADFIREAHRVLKENGRVQIAEVRSRIEYSHGRKKGSGDNKNKDENNDTSLTGTLEEFVQVLSQLGFECAKTDRSNKMFLFLELKKNGNVPDQTLEFSAKPCIYKRR